MYFNWNTRRVKYNLHVRNHGYPDLEVEIKTVDQSKKKVLDQKYFEVIFVFVS